MLNIIVDGEIQCRFKVTGPSESRMTRIMIGSSDSSDVYLAGADKRHVTIHVKKSHFRVQLHSDNGFQYKQRWLFPTSVLLRSKSGHSTGIDLKYGETFTIDRYVINVERD